eukprot:GHVT01077447.1.p1 GENE.GHVT01077447.1~~GHVT01077447.1.p1  ORF type:complete len:568 (-),score=24.69 GHVT01077447.1:1144-2847(-)
MWSLPNGRYRVGYEYAFLTDLSGNSVTPEVHLYFTISKIAECPHMYVTGFSIENGNPNGHYLPLEQVTNNRVAWKGGDQNNMYIYWKKPSTTTADQPGNWVLDSNLDESNFIGYPDLELMDSLPESEKSRPPSGLWWKWMASGREEQPHVIVHCMDTDDRKQPELTSIEPKSGQAAWPVDGVLKLVFSEPINYGHWGRAILTGRNTEDKVVFVSDWEGNMRDKETKVLPPTSYTIPAGTNGEPQTIERAGILELHPSTPLEPGETYDIEIELGFITDLAYNPCRHITSGNLVFTTYGAACSPFQNLGSAYNVRGSGSAHNVRYEVECAPGYSPEGEAQGAVYIVCDDGEWTGTRPVCKAECGMYPDVGDQYTVEGRLDSYRHGDVVTLSCSSTGLQLSGTQSFQTLVCRDGVWDQASVRCGATCGPLSSLGKNYSIDGDARQAMIGAVRNIMCVPPARAVGSLSRQTLKCEESGWTPLGIECYLDCATNFPSPGPAYVVEGTYRQHGSTRVITCAEGFGSVSEVDEGIATCFDGNWISDEKLECRGQYHNCFGKQVEVIGTIPQWSS